MSLVYNRLMGQKQTEKNRILIVGGAGFIGYEFVKLLTSGESFEVHVVDCDASRLSQLDLPVPSKHFVDASDAKGMSKLISDNSFDGLVHLAANSDIKSGSVSSELDFQNTLITSLVLSEIVKVRHFKFLLFASTSAIYGEKNEPISLQEKTSNFPISKYGWAKLASEYALSASAAISNTPFALVRFPNVVGPNPTHGLLFDLKAKLLRNSKALEILGNGQQRKPFLHVADLCEVLVRSLQVTSEGSNLELNVGPGDTISVSEIVEMVVEITTLNPAIHYGSEPFGWPGDVPSYEYADKLPNQFADLQIRNSAKAVRDSFESYWNMT